MRVDFGLQQAKVRNRERQYLWRVVKAVGGSLAVGGAGLIFGLAVGLHDARWDGVWTVIGEASSPFSAPDVRGVALAAKAQHGGSGRKWARSA